MIALLLILFLSPGAPCDSLLARADFNRPAWEAAFSACEGMDAGRLRYLLAELPVKDMFEADSQCVTNHVRGVSAGCIPGYSIPEDSLRKYVLWPTVAYWHHISDWRPVFRERLVPMIGDDVESTVSNVSKWFKERIAIEERRDLFGPPSGPIATLKRGWGSPMEAAGLYVAALRSLGIAARLGSGDTEIQYFDGTDWKVADSVSDDDLDTDDIHGEIMLPTASLVLRLTRDGEPYVNEEAVGIARWIDGRWEPVMPHVLPLEFRSTDSTMVIRTVPGRYLVTIGVRNTRGEPRIWRSTVDIFSDRETNLDIEVDIPFEELRSDDLVQGHVPALGGVSVTTASGRQRELLSFIGHQPVLLILVADGAEPSERFLGDLTARKTILDERALRTVIIGSDSSTAQIYADSRGMFAEALGLVKNHRIMESRLPVVLLYDMTGTLLLKREGYSSTLIDLIEFVLDHNSR